MNRVVVSGAFDGLRSRDVRFLEEASRLGELQVQLWSDQTVHDLEAKAPQFPQDERLYLISSVRYVSHVALTTAEVDCDSLPLGAPPHAIWVVAESGDTPSKRDFASTQGLQYRVLTAAELAGFPPESAVVAPGPPSRKRIIVTGCYDWFHSGHVRFFEEVSALGDLFVVVGHDQNLRLLKGEGHPMFPQDERRYMVQSIRHVQQALVSTGNGWMDAEPEIARIQPDVYAVNEDGDKPEKRSFCQAHGLEYVVLERAPREGLRRRTSTDLRGF